MWISIDHLLCMYIHLRLIVEVASSPDGFEIRQPIRLTNNHGK